MNGVKEPVCSQAEDDSSRFSYSKFGKQLAVSSISDGLTTESSRLGPIAQHKALSNRLVISESP
jgi:hypothetical protein